MERIPSNLPQGRLDSLQFESIISSTSHYGVVWKALYKGQPCAVKMVILTSGLHYDHEKKRYRSGEHPEKRFAIDEQIPYLHTMYRERKAMTPKDFKYEVDMIKQIGRLNLAPRLFDVWIDNKRPMHYGFIVMEYFPETVKSILLKRDLTSDELKRVKQAIKDFHSKGMCHRDMKPSNIGVTLDSQGKIDRVRFIDLAKAHEIKHKDEIKRDLDTFERHAKDNTELRGK